MKKFDFENHRLSIYDSIDEMPIVVFNRYNKYLLIDSGIGSNLEDIDVHIERIAKFINLDKQAAIDELLNMRQSLYFINQEVNPKHLAFAALIYSINDVKIDFVSDETLKDVLTRLCNLTESSVNTVIEDIKKKVDFELDAYFPESSNVGLKDAYDKLKQKVSLQLDAIINDADNSVPINNIEEYFLMSSKPKKFYGTDNAEIKFVKDFEKACVIITQEIGVDAKTMTALQFLIAMQHIKKRKSKKANNG